MYNLIWTEHYLFHCRRKAPQTHTHTGALHSFRHVGSPQIKPILFYNSFQSTNFTHFRAVLLNKILQVPYATYNIQPETLDCNRWLCGDTQIADLLPLSVHQASNRPRQQQLNRHSKPLSHSLLPCLLPQTNKTAPDKQNYRLEAKPISSANQPMAEQVDQQWPV